MAGPLADEVLAAVWTVTVVVLDAITDDKVLVVVILFTTDVGATEVDNDEEPFEVSTATVEVNEPAVVTMFMMDVDATTLDEEELLAVSTAELDVRELAAVSVLDVPEKSTETVVAVVTVRTIVVVELSEVNEVAKEDAVVAITTLSVTRVDVRFMIGKGRGCDTVLLRTKMERFPMGT